MSEQKKTKLGQELIKAVKEAVEYHSPRTEKSWICDDCADAKGWTLPHSNGITVISGLCGHCTREDECMLIPTSDFSGPNGKRATWD